MSETPRPQEPQRAESRPLSPTLRAFLVTWQPRQRRGAGMLSVLFTRLDALGRVHPEWAEYDLVTHMLAGLHLIIETDRLTGGHSREQIVEELTGLVALDQPHDSAQQHWEIASGVVDVLTNARERMIRFRDRYLTVDPSGVVGRAEPTFHFVEPVAQEGVAEGTLRATPAAINIFQNLFEFEPLDRAAAERYRSERMLRRRDYDEVLSSIERRSTSIHALRGQIEQIRLKIRFDVRAVDYVGEVIPRLDEALTVIGEQVEAEERFAEVIAEHASLHAPDRPRLARIEEQLQGLIQALQALLRTVNGIKRDFEYEQDRQLFTHRTITINPQPDLFVPLLHARTTEVVTMLEDRLAAWLGARAPDLLNLKVLMDRMVPVERRPQETDVDDPFDLGDGREDAGDLDTAIAAAVTQILSTVTCPTSLSDLLVSLAERADLAALTAEQRLQLPWAVAVTVTNAYGVTDTTEPASAAEPALFDHARLAVVRTDAQLRHGGIHGDDLVIVVRPTSDRTNGLDSRSHSDHGEETWTASTSAGS